MVSLMEVSARPCWAVGVCGIADAVLFGVAADGWDLRYDDPVEAVGRRAGRSGLREGGR